MATSLPRICAGATSAIYIGDKLEARPMATPPNIRHAMKMANFAASAFPSEVTANSKAAMKEGLRAADHHPVPAEQQPPHRRDHGNEPDIAEIEFGLERRGFSLRC